MTLEVLQTTVTRGALRQGHSKLKPFQELPVCRDSPLPAGAHTRLSHPAARPQARSRWGVSGPLHRRPAPHGDPCPPTEPSPPPTLRHPAGRQATAGAAGTTAAPRHRSHRLRPVEPGAAEGVGGRPSAGRQGPAQRAHGARQRPAPPLRHRHRHRPPHRAPPLPALGRPAPGACAVRRAVPSRCGAPWRPGGSSAPRRRRARCGAGAAAAAAAGSGAARPVAARPPRAQPAGRRTAPAAERGGREGSLRGAGGGGGRSGSGSAPAGGFVTRVTRPRRNQRDAR